MKLAQSKLALRELLDMGTAGTIGFVPTMGALHQGHLSLVEKSISECDRTVISIFVNPTQFNDRRDLERYPRNLEQDLSLLEPLLDPDDIVFTPEYSDLYRDEKSFELDLEGLDKVMEGKYRSGHFEGVVRVVKLLFEAVRPGKAYFGQKDFQQLTIIRTMVRKLGMAIDIVSCPVLREPNGLAMSSRNERLAPDQRSAASVIYRTLKENSRLHSPSQLSMAEKIISDTINSTPGFTVEYFDVVDNVNLRKVSPGSLLSPDRQYFGCIAVYAGEIRLIDNVEFSFQLLKG
ncbi:MAG: pantoate--beta-alanine ligase [Marinilabiliaceae bacterium]|jgi:pantoate--beta-alanine ligase|nr:pantoate--beta-alanine ligase [Marinilabiliaceae bacterium]